jgi:capsular polysaccharide biosynthesis protein
MNTYDARTSKLNLDQFEAKLLRMYSIFEEKITQIQRITERKPDKEELNKVAERLLRLKDNVAEVKENVDEIS